MRDSSDGELAIGLRDAENGRKRMEGLNGLNEQIEWNKNYINERMISAYFGFSILSFVWAWAFNIPSLVKYSITALMVGSILIHIFLIVKKRVGTKNIREKQLEEFRKSKENKS